MADNRHHVFEIIRDHGPIRLDQIAQRTGLGVTTVREIVRGLRDVDAISQAVGQADTEQRTGRPALRYSVTPNLGHVVGLQFEPTNIRAAIANLDLSIVAKRERTMPVADDAKSALDAAAEMVDAMLGAERLQRDRILGAAMGIIAPVDMVDGSVRETTRLEGWVGLRPAAELERRLGLPADVGNDATLAGLAESVVGAAKGSAHVVYLKLSAAVGSGIVIDGRPYQGAAGTAGEIAHMAIDKAGILCFCGNRGCLWTVIGGEQLIRDLELTTAVIATRLHRMESLDLDRRLEAVIGWARDGDIACQAALREAGENAGRAAVLVCNLLNPETIVVGGTLSRAGELFLGPLRDTVARYTKHLPRLPPPERAHPEPQPEAAGDSGEHGSPAGVRIKPAELDEWAEVLGAGAMAMRSTNPRNRQRLMALIDKPRS